MTNLSFSFPSITQGAVLDVKKGRSSLSLTRSDLRFLSDLLDAINLNIKEDDNVIEFHNPIIDVDAEEYENPALA